MRKAGLRAKANARDVENTQKKKGRGSAPLNFKCASHFLYTSQRRRRTSPELPGKILNEEWT
jgi:hypothetical protein